MVVLDERPFLRPEDVPVTGEAITFTNEGEVRKKEDTGFDQDTFQIMVKRANADERILTLNRTAQRAIVTLFGPDTVNWIGKQIRISTIEVNVRGQKKKSIQVEVSSQK